MTPILKDLQIFVTLGLMQKLKLKFCIFFSIRKYLLLKQDRI